jgi:hypothetical protein
MKRSIVWKSVLVLGAALAAITQAPAQSEPETAKQHRADARARLEAAAAALERAELSDKDRGSIEGALELLKASLQGTERAGIGAAHAKAVYDVLRAHAADVEAKGEVARAGEAHQKAMAEVHERLSNAAAAGHDAHADPAHAELFAKVADELHGHALDHAKVADHFDALREKVGVAERIADPAALRELHEHMARAHAGAAAAREAATLDGRIGAKAARRERAAQRGDATEAEIEELTAEVRRHLRDVKKLMREIRSRLDGRSAKSATSARWRDDGAPAAPRGEIDSAAPPADARAPRASATVPSRGAGHGGGAGGATGGRNGAGRTGVSSTTLAR